MSHASSRRSPRARRALLGGALTIGALACVPSVAGAAPVQWSELDPLGKPQPVQVHQAVGEQKMIMVAIPGGGWSAGTNTLLDLYGYLKWWTELAQSKGISVHVITHRQGGYSGAVPEELGDLGDALGKIHDDNPGVPICLYGLSSGGHLAAMLQILRPEITKCVVSDGGPLDMDAFFQDSSELRGITLGDFFTGQIAQTQVRDWFNTPEHPDNVSRLSPSTQTGRIGDLFAIEGGPNPDGSAADRSVGDRQGELIRQQIPNRTTVRYVHAAKEGQDSLPTAHNLYEGFLDGSPGGAEATEARKVYGEAADWMLRQAAKSQQTPTTVPLAPQPFTPAVQVPKLKVSVRGTRVRPDAKGRISIRVRCAGATISCAGRVKATVSSLPTRAIAYRVVTAKSTFATVRVALTARQQALLQTKPSVLARVQVTGTGGAAKAVAKTTNVRVLRSTTLARKNTLAKRKAAAAKAAKAKAAKR